MKTYIIGITGASGSLYGLRTAEALLAAGAGVHVVATDTGERIIAFETGQTLKDWADAQTGSLVLEANDNLFSMLASGSNKADGMAVVPCSMSALGQLAAGITPNLLTRAADVSLKQKRPLVIVPRETPLTRIHLQNMLTLSEAGASIVPAMPAFYQKPETIEDMVSFMAGRILDCFGIENEMYTRWNGL